MKVMILAAGYGTRLYPLTLDRPKALIKVAGRSILERLLEKLLKIDICSGVYIVTNNKFHGMINSWVLEHDFPFSVEVINDNTVSNDDRLGAIGDMQLVIERKKPSEDILVMAGDNLFDFDLSEFIEYSIEKRALCVALYDVNDIELAKKYGVVKISDRGVMEKFQEKPENPESTLASTGVYYFPQETIVGLKEYMTSGLTTDAPGNFISWVALRKEVYGFVFNEKWYDIGDKRSLEKADKEYRYKEL